VPIVKPRMLPRFKAECIQEYEEPKGKAYIASYVKDVMASKYAMLHHEVRDQTATLADRLALGMRVSENYHVSREICEFISMAAENLPRDEDFQRWDLPAEHGFLYLEKPLRALDVHNKGVSTRVLVWNVQDGETVRTDFLGQIHKERKLGVNVSLYFMNHSREDVDDYAYLDDQMRRAMIERFGAKRAGEMMRDTAMSMRLWGTTFMSFGEPSQGMLVETGEGYLSVSDLGFLSIENFLLTFWKFSKTELPMLHFEQVSPPKSEARFMRRMEIQHGTTTVITLRRRTPSAKTGEMHMDFSHRFMVRGHWAKRRCGVKHQDVRYVYIQPYIKGPEDKPLRANHEIVHKVSR